MKSQHPECFKNVKVLDVGSLDVNGNNRQFFEDSEYIGIDVIKGKNVDIVSPCHQWKTDQLFDTIISTSALEHDMYYGKTLIKMYELLKPGGWLFICACRNWPVHGTKTNGPINSGTSQIDENGWSGYYRNVKSSDFDILQPFKEKFSISSVDIERHKAKDIHFIAQKIK
jgi:hypothetical protein